MLGAFLLFCILTSSVYFINDLADIDADRLHPFKKKRPLASGALSPSVAWAVAALGIITALGCGLLLSFYLFVMMLLYMLIQVLYSWSFKHVSILDVLTIAAGFMIRIYAGSVVVNLHMSVWFLLTVLSVSIFLAVGKRQSERTLLTGHGTLPLAATRKSLSKYSARLLDIYTGMFANATWLTYAIFAFQNDNLVQGGLIPTLQSILPRAFSAQKWLMLTVPVVIYGVMRYLQLVYEDNKGESPERVLLNDKALLSAVTVWSLLVFVIIYVLG